MNSQESHHWYTARKGFVAAFFGALAIGGGATIVKSIDDFFEKTDRTPAKAYVNLSKIPPSVEIYDKQGRPVAFLKGEEVRQARLVYDEKTNTLRYEDTPLRITREAYEVINKK